MLPSYQSYQHYQTEYLVGPQLGALWTPEEGKSIQLSLVCFTVNADCHVTLWADLPYSTDAPVVEGAVDSSEVVLFDHDLKSGSGFDKLFPYFIQLAPNASIYLETDAGNIGITLAGWEV